MADANRVGLSYVEETDWGVTPTASPFQELRFTGESLGHNVDFITSAEIRDDRQVTDLVKVDEEAAGDINFELSFEAFDRFLEGALWSDWSTALGIEDVVTKASIATGFISTTASAFANVVAGQWVEVGGFTGNSGENNGYYYVVSKDAASVELTVVPKPTSDEALGATVTFNGSYIRNGIVEHSYTIERKHADITQYFDFIGMVVQQMALSVEASAILSGSFGFIGKETTLATSPATSGAETAAPSYDVMNAMANVGQIMEGSTLATIDTNLFIQAITFTVANNIRGQKGIGHVGSADIGTGQCDVTGSLNAYFKDNTLFDKYIGDDESGLSFKVEDGDGYAYIFTFPRIKFSADAINASGANTDIMEGMEFTAFRHATYDCTVQIDKFATWTSSSSSSSSNSSSSSSSSSTSS